MFGDYRIQAVRVAPYVSYKFMRCWLTAIGQIATRDKLWPYGGMGSKRVFAIL